MVKPICKDELFLSIPSKPASKEDIKVAIDLMDTLKAHSDECVGMAANMIGINKNIIAVNIGISIIPMLNPFIRKKETPYETEEGCLSLNGVRKTTRYEKIEVEYMDMNFKKQRQVFRGFIAQIIQHECDHLDGKII